VTQPFNQRIGIRVTNAQTDMPLKDMKVSFSLPQMGASAAFSDSTVSKTVETNADGLAQVDLGNANTIAGTYFVITQIVGQNQNIKFVLTNRPADVYTMKITGGTNQKTNINTPFEKPLTLTLTDVYNNVIEGAYVNFFNYPSNNNIFSPNAIWTDSSALNIRYIKTDANGIARIYVKANQYDGTYSSVFASCSGRVVYYNLTNIDPLKTNISTIDDSFSWILSPNPSTGIITVENNSLSETIKVCNVYDITGILRGHFENGNSKPILTFDLHHLENGYYMIELTTEKKKIYKKVIIQKQ
jgi:hypothetical protein